MTDYRYVVAFARITTEENSPELQGVYFGGVAHTIQEAEQIAKECVNTAKGYLIQPRIMPLEGAGKLIDALYEAADEFEKRVKRMVEANETISKANAIHNRTHRRSGPCGDY